MTNIDNQAIKWPKILLLGDSQTQEAYGVNSCWVSILSDHFQRRCDIINRGFTGYNTRWIKLILPKIVDADMLKECAAVTLFLGSNDANLPGYHLSCHVPIEEYIESLSYITTYLMDLKVSKEKIILISPPPVDESLWTKSMVKEGRPAEHGMRNDIVSQYAKACCDVARDLGTDCVDLYSEMIKDKDWKRFVNVDGLHLANEGGHMLAKLLEPKLENLAKDCSQIFADWSVIDNENPGPQLLL